MEPKKYIESGILDDYVMGFVSEQERQEVQCLAKIYPEINEALRKAEDLMATWAADNAVAPPPDLKAKIMANLGEQEPSSRPMPDSVQEPVVRDLNAESKPESKQQTPFAWIAAAAAVLLAAFLAWEWQKSLDLQSEMQNIIVQQESSMEDLKSDLEGLELTAEEMQASLAVLADPSVQKVALNSVKEDVSAAATLYWNPEEKKTYFLRNALPEEPTEAQYQLWAIVRGKPVSMGLLALNDDAGLQEMEGIEKADAFAITLEPLGGSENPTLDQMVVLGKV